jgi:ribonuclease T1
VRLVAGLVCLVFAAVALAILPVGEVRFANLPPEARSMVAQIMKGGPFLHELDGVTFGNRERMLPPRERGWYREYTVNTPGGRTRGARRIVAGRDGTLYYTADHYRSFKRILE